MCPADSPCENLPQGMGVLLGLVRAELVRALEQELARQGMDLRFSHFQVISFLHALGPMSAGELARALSRDGGAVTRLLDQLEARDCLCRKPDLQDRRALRIDLTATGRALYRHVKSCSERVLDAAQRALTDEERAHFVDYLQRILITLRDPR